jgi:hypothetical protein
VNAVPVNCSAYKPYGHCMDIGMKRANESCFAGITIWGDATTGTVGGTAITHNLRAILPNRKCAWQSLGLMLIAKATHVFECMLGMNILVNAVWHQLIAWSPCSISNDSGSHVEPINDSRFSATFTRSVRI